MLSHYLIMKSPGFEGDNSERRAVALRNSAFKYDVRVREVSHAASPLTHKANEDHHSYFTYIGLDGLYNLHYADSLIKKMGRQHASNIDEMNRVKQRIQSQSNHRD